MIITLSPLECLGILLLSIGLLSQIRPLPKTITRFIHISIVGTFIANSLHGQGLNPSQIFQKVQASVVIVKTQDAEGKTTAQGSGVKLPSGRIITNFHVVKDGIRFLVGNGKTYVAATIYASDAEKDLCLLNAPTVKAPSVVVGQASSLKVGDAVYAIGSPQGLELSLSNGIVSQLRGGKPPIIQTTAAISHGSSGGGLFDNLGKLVGITSFYMEGGQSLNFAVPIEWANDLRVNVSPNPAVRPKASWVAQATKLEEGKDWEKMLTWCEEWLDADSNSNSAWFTLGNAQAGLNRFSEAIDSYRRAISIDPSDSTAWNNLGIAYKNLNHNTEAIEAYQHALAIDPNFIEAMCNLALAYSDQGRDSEAIDVCRKALVINPRFAGAWNAIGVASTNIHKAKEAIEAFQQALKIDPVYSQAWYNLGCIYDDNQLYSEAIKSYSNALKFNPTLVEGWYNLGLTYANLLNYPNSINAFHKALEIDSTHKDAWFNLGVSYLLNGNNAMAIEVAKKLRKYSPDRAHELIELINKY